MRILALHQLRDIQGLFRSIGVDPYGIDIMAAKTRTYLIKLDAVSTMAANILKQEMLSCGGDAAVARHALTGSKQPTACVLIGTQAQLMRLAEKLEVQPFGLSSIGSGIATALSNISDADLSLRLGRHKLTCGARTLVMGIVNVTPDSFSGDGLMRVSTEGGPAYDGAGLRRRRTRLQRGSSPANDLNAIVDRIEQLVADGADIIDIGGESSRPGAKPVALKEELKRVIPVIKAAARRIKVPVSIDTYKPQVAARAIDNGAALVNDISGLRDNSMARVIARGKSGVVIMHMLGTPRAMQHDPRYADLMGGLHTFFQRAIDRAQDAGISPKNIIIDPGIGFGKTVNDNCVILKHLAELRLFGKPVLVGTSRKSFIGALNNAGVRDRVPGTIASCVTAAANGAHIIRVHDVRAVRQALHISDAIKHISESPLKSTAF